MTHQPHQIISFRPLVFYQNESFLQPGFVCLHGREPNVTEVSSFLNCPMFVSLRGLVRVIRDLDNSYADHMWHVPRVSVCGKKMTQNVWQNESQDETMKVRHLPNTSDNCLYANPFIYDFRTFIPNFPPLMTSTAICKKFARYSIWPVDSRYHTCIAALPNTLSS